MRKRTWILCGLFLLLFVPSKTAGQDNSLVSFLIQVERRYGNDVDLVNGEKYFYPYGRSDGNPFLYPFSRPSQIEVRGKAFPDQPLRFDIYNQQLVLDYVDQNGAVQSLVLRREWVESFRIGEKRFVSREGPGGREGYFQVIFEGGISCYYRWSKEYVLNLNSGQQSYYFTDAEKEAFLLRGGEFMEFRNNRTFRKAFDKPVQKEIRQYMREESIRIRRANDEEMKRVMEFCNAKMDETI